MKLLAAPTVKVVLLALVMAGAWVAAWLTVRVKFWVAAAAHAVGGGEGEGGRCRQSRRGVPLRVAVPLPLSTKVTPLGRVPFRSGSGSGSRWSSP